MSMSTNTLFGMIGGIRGQFEGNQSLEMSLFGDDMVDPTAGTLVCPVPTPGLRVPVTVVTHPSFLPVRLPSC